MSGKEEVLIYDYVDRHRKYVAEFANE